MHRLLVVCTANVCRSPVAAAFLRRELAPQPSTDDDCWVVTSAGTGQYTADVDRATIRAAADAGLDIKGHRPRVLDPNILADDGADLVLTLARSHLPAIVAVDPTAWPRTFTLKELARRATQAGEPDPGENFGAWRERMATGRLAREMLLPDPADDVADPYGLPRRHHDAMVAEVGAEIQRLVRSGPWCASRG